MAVFVSIHVHHHAVLGCPAKVGYSLQAICYMTTSGVVYDVDYVLSVEGVVISAEYNADFYVKGLGASVESDRGPTP